MSSDLVIGIVGMGNFGSALAKRLAPQRSLLLSDAFLGKARQMAKILKADFEPVPGLLKKADIILLAIPPDEICPLIREHEDSLKKGALLVNMATSLDTRKISGILDRQDLCVVGLKPVTQAYALARGYRTLFVSSCEDEGLRGKLSDLLKPVGEIVLGDEELVGEINAEATRSGLKLFLSLQEKLKLMGISHEFIEVAIKTVAVGTILDYPTEGPNAYIEARLNELVLERKM